MLKSSHKILLMTEVVVCFGPVAMLLAIGMLLVPLQIRFLFDEPLLWQAPAYVIGSVVCGIGGVVALGFTLGKLFEDQQATGLSVLVCCGIALGLLPLVPIAVSGDSMVWRILVLLPIAATAHILFLGRRVLFISASHAVKCLAIAGAAALVLPAVLLAFDRMGGTEVLGQRDLWIAMEPERYEYTVQVSGWFAPEILHLKRIQVEHGEITSATYLSGSRKHDVGDPAPFDSLWTIDRAFEELLAAERKGWTVRARYDDRWGFVARAFVDGDEWPAGWDFQVRDFRLLEADDEPDE